MDMYNYEMAQKFCQRALEIDNDNVRALETTATLLLEVSLGLGWRGVHTSLPSISPELKIG